jgi:GH25 family lysozyme M1 (1,4-beta-N-acetylmuramidase)
MRADVVDTSHYDDVQDGFAGTKAMGILGVINKLTEGVGYVDPSFNWRRGPAARAGLLYGAYHFIRPGSPLTQVKQFLNRVGDTTGLLLALDHEDPDVTMLAAANWIGSFHELTGSWPVYYSYSAFIQQRRARMDARIFGKCALWLAAYNDHPQWPTNIWPNYYLHQFTGDGSGPQPHHVPGISIAGGIDLNIAHDRDSLASTWATIDKPQAPKMLGFASMLPPLPMGFDPSPVIRIARDSKVATYVWSGRGRAPMGYTKGVALTFARCLKNLAAGDPAAQFMAQANTHQGDRDALSWYAGIFNSRGMANDTAGPDTLRHLFALLMGLGMRESSGVFTEGRDLSADNVSADTAEAGLFQQSWNSHVAAPALFEELMASYSTDLDGFVDVFREGVSKPMSGNFGTGKGRVFQELAKHKPAFACEAAAVGLRCIRAHWGPLNRYQAEVTGAANAMLRDVQAYVMSAPSEGAAVT